jgi:uncharacterized protein with HEPN domain
VSLHSDCISLKDMLDHANEAKKLLGDSDRDALRRNRVLQLALTRLAEIIGEAANRISRETRDKYSEIPWSHIIGMRNRLIHGYDVIDYDLLWDTVTTDLPPLIATLNEIIENLL